MLFAICACIQGKGCLPLGKITDCFKKVILVYLNSEEKIRVFLAKIRSLKVDKEKTECANIQGCEKLQHTQNTQLYKRYGRSGACDRRWG